LIGISRARQFFEQIAGKIMLADNYSAMTVLAESVDSLRLRIRRLNSMVTASETPGLLCVDHAWFAYSAVDVLTDVSFGIESGEIAALIGRNGAGKSTLLRCVAGWSRLKDGEVLVQGIRLRASEREFRQRLVLVPDTPSFYDDLTAWEHIQFVAQAHRLSDWRAGAEDLLERFGLWRQREAFPFTYSRGMRYKLAVCMALLVEPNVLLLDEPFGPLDPFSMEQLWGQLQQCRQRKMGVLLSSHTMPDYAQPDRYLVMEEEQIILQGTPHALGLSGPPDLNALLRMALESQGVREDGE
jgi:ABC-2 type transport system ATP-binding protein